MIFTIHGDPGCEIWFRRFADLSKTGRIWELNEEGEQLRVTRNEEDYHLLARRFSRYEKARAEALEEIRYEQMQSVETDRFIEWIEARNRVLEKRDMAGYSSEIEEKQYQERKGAKGGKGSNGKKGYGKNKKKGKSDQTMADEIGGS